MHPDTRRTVVRQAHHNNMQRFRIQRLGSTKHAARVFATVKIENTEEATSDCNVTAPITTGELPRIEIRYVMLAGPTAGYGRVVQSLWAIRTANPSNVTVAISKPTGRQSTLLSPPAAHSALKWPSVPWDSRRRIQFRDRMCPCTGL